MFNYQQAIIGDLCRYRDLFSSISSVFIYTLHMWKYFTRHQQLQVNITDKYYFSLLLLLKIIENKETS